MRRIGILGGTFNPIHIGHMFVAETVLEKLQLDQVIFVPCNLPPHKTGHNVIDAKDRYEMVKLAVKDHSCFFVSDLEIKRPGKSYTYETIMALKLEMPEDAKLYFIIGADNLSALHQWKNIDVLLKMVSFVVVNRPGERRQHPHIKARSVTMPGLDVASSYIRSRIAANKSIQHLVPEKVRQYIQTKKLYQSV